MTLILNPKKRDLYYPDKIFNEIINAFQYVIGCAMNVSIVKDLNKFNN